ncbi:MAG TPA: ATP-binding protein [Armatimonadota bacterium]|jgi:serine/threonine-protein kinase RsbW
MFVRMQLDLPAEASYVRLCRHLAETVLSGMGVSPQDVNDVEVIMGEVCANAVRHAYNNPSETYRVELDVCPETVRVTVRDHGKGIDLNEREKDPREMREGGRGMFLINTLADRVDMSVLGGTTVTATLGLHYK